MLYTDVLVAEVSLPCQSWKIGNHNDYYTVCADTSGFINKKKGEDQFQFLINYKLFTAKLFTSRILYSIFTWCPKMLYKIQWWQRNHYIQWKARKFCIHHIILIWSHVFFSIYHSKIFVASNSNHKVIQSRRCKYSSAVRITLYLQRDQ